MSEEGRHEIADALCASGKVKRIEGRRIGGYTPAQYPQDGQDIGGVDLQNQEISDYS
jgi:hypothetical protein